MTYRLMPVQRDCKQALRAVSAVAARAAVLSLVSADTNAHDLSLMGKGVGDAETYWVLRNLALDSAHDGRERRPGVIRRHTGMNA